MTTIAFTGDIAFSKYFRDSWQDEELMSPEIVSFLSGSDHCIANVEGPLFDGGTSTAKLLNHASNPGAAGWLKRIGADIWNLCNNHVADCGIDGLLQTQQIAAQNGSVCIGAEADKSRYPQPFYLPEEGGIGIVNCCYVSELTKKMPATVGILLWDDEEEVKRQIREVKSKVRWCIVMPHGGDEFTDMPEPWNRQRYLRYLQYGADVVVSHHPHVVQNYETVGDKIIFYSLGNFVFDTDYQRQHVYTDQGQLVKLSIDGDRFSWEGLSVKIDREEHRVVPCDTHAIFSDINGKSYKKLWPVAAAGALRAQEKIRIYEDPERFEPFSGADWLRYDMKEEVFRKLLEDSLKPCTEPLSEEEAALDDYLRKR